MHVQNFKTLTQLQLHEKDIERTQNFMVRTDSRITDRETHPQTTPRVSVETYSTRGLKPSGTKSTSSYGLLSTVPFYSSERYNSFTNRPNKRQSRERNKRTWSNLVSRRVKERKNKSECCANEEKIIHSKIKGDTFAKIREV